MKPTLTAQLTQRLTSIFDIRNFPGSQVDDRLGRARSRWPARIIAASAFSRAVRSAARAANGPERPPLGEAQRRVHRFCLGQIARVGRRPPRRSRRRAAPGRPAARHSRAPVSDRAFDSAKARRRHSRAGPAARPMPRAIGLAVPVPAALADLAREIGEQLGAGRGEAPDIAQRQLVELAGVERRARFAGLSGGSWPCLCHSPPP